MSLNLTNYCRALWYSWYSWGEKSTNDWKALEVPAFPQIHEHYMPLMPRSVEPFVALKMSNPKRQVKWAPNPSWINFWDTPNTPLLMWVVSVGSGRQCCTAALGVVHTPACDYIVLADWYQLWGAEHDAVPADNVLIMSTFFDTSTEMTCRPVAKSSTWCSTLNKNSSCAGWFWVKSGFQGWWKHLVHVRNIYNFISYQDTQSVYLEFLKNWVSLPIITTYSTPDVEFFLTI